MGVIEGAGKVGTRVGIGTEKWAVAEYDFAVDGGAVSTITLRGDSIPSGAVIREALVKVQTVPTSGGAATIALDSEGAGDLKSAAAYNGAPYSSTGTKVLTQTLTTAPITTTAKRSITATIAAAALTAGKFKVLVRYLEVA